MYIVANGTETVAVSQGNGEHKLYGYKWFTSATDADMALTLAREQDDKGNTIPVCFMFTFLFANYSNREPGACRCFMLRLEMLLEGTTILSYR